MEYGFTKTVALSYEEAIDKATEELKKEGFGVLTVIDVKETLKKKLNVDFDRYIILGACNPPFAYEALKAEESVGLLMPCNVVVHENAGSVKISFFNPSLIAMVSDNPKLKELAVNLTEKIKKVMDSI
ncbi:MAG: DUF302 domain-containing protein [Ignavibacteriae bacterium]|nr:DUF302 domain-containing protein [Ignavibacteriota bacterium]